jgi:hypothetical protein
MLNDDQDLQIRPTAYTHISPRNLSMPIITTQLEAKVVTCNDEDTPNHRPNCDPMHMRINNLTQPSFTGDIRMYAFKSTEWLVGYPWNFL